MRASGMEYIMDFYSHMANFSRYPNRLEMLKNNFIDELSVTVDYEAYFRECDVKSCTYFDVVQISSSALLSMLLGVLGGFWSVTFRHGLCGVRWAQGANRREGASRLYAGKGGVVALGLVTYRRVEAERTARG